MDPSEQPTKKMSSESTDETLTLQNAKSDDNLVIHQPWYSGKVIEGIFRIEEEIARGGMGVVHKATDLATNDFVVIKSLLPEVAQDEHYKKRFIREAEEWVKLGKHPNIVRCYTAHEIEYLPRIVAEYVDGQDLSTLLKEGPIEFDKALKLAVQICWGMDYAHEKGLAHRDLKPGNILLDREGNAKVTDFGLVKVAEDEGGITQSIDPKAITRILEKTLLTQGTIGTPEYIAPEQWDGKGEKSSDIYAFGVIMYELFCGRRPFDFPELKGLERITAYHKSHTQDSPPPPGELPEVPTDIPEELGKLMQQCLEKLPQDRPNSFTNIAETLNALAKETTGKDAALKPNPEELNRQDRLDQANAYLRIGKGCHFRGDYDKAKDLYEKAHEIFKTENDQKGIASYYSSFGSFLAQQGNYDQAIEMFQKSLQINETLGSKTEIASCYNNIGLVKMHQSDYDLALELFQKCIEIKESLGDKVRIATCYRSISMIKQKQGNYDQAIEMLQKSLEIEEVLGNKAGISGCYVTIGNIKQNLGNNDEALGLYKKSLKIKKALGDKKGIASCYNNMGIIKQSQGNYDQSLNLFRKSLEIFKALGDKANIATCYNNMGIIKQNQGNYNKALELHQKSLEIRKTLGDKAGIAKCYYNMGVIKTNQGHYDKAMEMLNTSLNIAHVLKLPLQKDIEELINQIKSESDQD